MRIIVITNRFGDVGTHPQLTRLALHLKDNGHDVRAVSLAPPGTIAAMFADAGIETDVIVTSRRGSFLPAIGKLAALFRRRRPDVIVVFLYEAIIPTRFAARLGRAPAVISSIRNEYFGPRYRELVLRATEGLSSATVVNSRMVADSLIRRRVASRRQLVVIYNGIDVSLFRPSPGTRERTRASLGLANDEFVWLTVGRLAEQKAYPSLVRAFSAVVERLPRSRLLVVGRGQLRTELEDLVRRSGLQATISLLGFRSDVPVLMAAADAFVMASRYEGMPNAVIEALAAGLPVVGTDVGGMSELIREGVNGYLVPPAEPEALAAVMSKLSRASAEERGWLGEQGRALVRELCDLQRVMDSWTKLIGDPARSRISP